MRVRRHDRGARGARGHVGSHCRARRLGADARRARERLSGRPVELLLGDAATFVLPARSFDVLFSRFGVMFFDEPQAAFAHLRRALKVGGRVAMVVWQSQSANPWATVPIDGRCRHRRTAGARRCGRARALQPLRSRRVYLAMLRGAGYTDVDADRTRSGHHGRRRPPAPSRGCVHARPRTGSSSARVGVARGSCRGHRARRRRALRLRRAVGGSHAGSRLGHHRADNVNNEPASAAGVIRRLLTQVGGEVSRARRASPTTGRLSGAVARATSATTSARPGRRVRRSRAKPCRS